MSLSALPSELLALPSRLPFSQTLNSVAPLFSMKDSCFFLRLQDLKTILSVSQLCCDSCSHPQGSFKEIIVCTYMVMPVLQYSFAGHRTHEGVSSLRPPQRFWRLYLNIQAWWQLSLPTGHLAIPALRALDLTLGLTSQPSIFL